MSLHKKKPRWNGGAFKGWLLKRFARNLNHRFWRNALGCGQSIRDRSAVTLSLASP